MNYRGWVKWAALGLGAALGLAILAWLPVDANPRFSICFSRQFLHLSCPGCGMTRAFAFLARGDFPASLSFHPLALLLALEAILVWSSWPLVLLRILPRPSSGAINTWLLVHLALLLGTWVVRLVTGTLP